MQPPFNVLVSVLQTCLKPSIHPQPHQSACLWLHVILKSTKYEVQMARETEYRLYGEVLWYHTTLEFGFIRPNDGRADLYVHRNSVRSKDNLIKGEVVEYGLRQYPDYLTEAIDITGPGEGPVQLHGSGGGRDSVVDQTKVCDNCGFKGHETSQCYRPEEEKEEEESPEEANVPSNQEGSG